MFLKAVSILLTAALMLTTKVKGNISVYVGTLTGFTYLKSYYLPK